MAEELVKGRIWSFSYCEYDEAKRQLWVRGRPAVLQYKPLEVLLALLRAPDHTLSKDQLLGQVWEGEADDPSLKTAINRLRDAFADPDRDAIIRTIHGFGYKIMAQVRERESTATEEGELYLREGDLVPGQEQWRLTKALSPARPYTVWLAEHLTTREVLVFKFAPDGVRLQALQREVTLFRLLKSALGTTSGFVRVLNWRFTSKPFFIATEYGGLNLIEWVGSQRDTGGPSREICLRIMADLAAAVARAHSIGVLHNDLKPSNILVAPIGNGAGWQVSVADLGIASLQEPSRLSDLHITNHGFSDAESGVAGGSSLYRAPEVRPGAPPTTSADIYALGIILFQIVCGDFRDTPSPGWEKRIDDPLLQRDIEDTANLDPARRLSSAAEVAYRLQTLEDRRQDLLTAQRDRERQANEAGVAEEREQRLARRLAAAQARRPWLVATVCTLLVGLAVSLVLYRNALHERDIAIAVNGFLADDLLTRASPFKTGEPSESLVDAVNRASPQIDAKFSREPLVAARLHSTIARALNKRADFRDADREYKEAADLYLHARGPLSVEAISIQMQRAAMLARNPAAGSMREAKAIFAQEQPALAEVHGGQGDLPAWVDFAHGLIQMFDSDAAGAAATFRHGLQITEALPNPNASLAFPMKQSLAFAYVRLGEGGKAETLIKELLATETRVHYTDRPNPLNLGLNLAQAYMSEQKNREAIDGINRIYPDLVKQLGPLNDLSITALGVRAQAEASLGLWDDAAHDSLTIHTAAGGDRSFFDLGSLADGSLYLCRGGHLQEGEADARAAYNGGQVVFAENRAALGSFAFSLATCEVGLHHFDEADHLLSTINVPDVSQMNADADWSADVDLTRAEIALGRRDLAAARKSLASAQNVCTRPDAAPYRKSLFRRIESELSNSE